MEKKSQSYEDLGIYQLAKSLAIEIHKMTLDELPKFEMYETGTQIRRSSKSIGANIVEGFGRKRHKGEYIQFLTYALASCDETKNHLEILYETKSFKKERYEHFIKKYRELGGKIYNFRKAVINSHGSQATGHRLNLQPATCDLRPATCNLRPATCDLRPATCDLRPATSKGVALIIVIFAMMLFAVLGWTLANLQSGDFEINLRNLDSERALGLAEAGTQWALSQLSADSCWRTGGDCNSVDSDCSDNGDWLNTPHSLSPGEYNICCRNPSAAEASLGYNTAIESRGYVPNQTSYRARREIKLLLTVGSFTKVLQAKNLFDWSAMHSGSRINGDIQALYYNGDGDTNYNEPNIDYRGGSSPLPPDGTGDERGIASEPYPAIDMAYYENEAKDTSYQPSGDNTWAPPRTATISNIQTIGGVSRITVNSAIFDAPTSQWNGQALRNITRGIWGAENWKDIQSTLSNSSVDLTGAVGWSIGDRVSVVPKILSTPWATDGNGRYYTVDFSCDYFTVPLSQWDNQAMRNFSRGTWAYSDWGVIQSVPNARRAIVRIDNSVNLGTSAWDDNNWVGEVKRYRDDVTDQYLWYIMADVLFDLRDRQSWEPASINGDIRFKKTGLVAEGDIAIKGPNKIRFNEKPFAYPNLASKNGNLTSPDTPSGGSDDARRGQRDFNDIVYTQNGSLDFNYLDAKAAYGNNVTFDGQVRLNYDNDLPRLTGFTWGFSNVQWAEQ